MKKKLLDPCGFFAAIDSTAKPKTATVYLNSTEYATYSRECAIEVAQEIRGCVVDDETGEIIAAFD